MVILQQDDCAPDALHTFQVAMYKDLGIGREDFIARGRNVSEDQYETIVKFGNFTLSIAADSPYWELSEDTSIPELETVQLKIVKTKSNVVLAKRKILSGDKTLWYEYQYEKLISFVILGINLTELQDKIEQIKALSHILLLSNEYQSSIDLGKQEIERLTSLAKDLVKKINRLEIKY